MQALWLTYVHCYQIAAIACDSVEEDVAWIKDIEEVGSTTVNFPIFSDTDRSVCEQFGMLMVSLI